MKLIGTHERSVIGPSILVAFSGSIAYQTLVSDPAATGPVNFILFTDQDVHFRQWPAALLSLTAAQATTDDELLRANTYTRITVTSRKDNGLAVVRAGASNGTLRCTNSSDKAPGVGVSA